LTRRARPGAGRAAHRPTATRRPGAAAVPRRQFNMPKEYDIQPTSGLCERCKRQLHPGEQFLATVTETDQSLIRNDFCLPCWEADGRDERPDVLGLWRARVPQPQQKTRLFVDDELLIDFFHRLSGADEPAKISFRFVLALVLMRKKLLVYDRAEKRPEGPEVWIMHVKGDDRKEEVIDPHMDDEKIAEVSHDLSQILEGQL